MHDPFERKRRGIGATVRDLRRRLEGLRDEEDGDARSRRPSLAWCRPFSGSAADVGPGCCAALLMADGRVLVGDVLNTSSACVVLRPLGRSRAVRIAAASVTAARVVGGHRLIDRRFVVERQRRGEWLLRAEFAASCNDDAAGRGERSESNE